MNRLLLLLLLSCCSCLQVRAQKKYSLEDCYQAALGRNTAVLRAQNAVAALRAKRVHDIAAHSFRNRE